MTKDEIMIELGVLTERVRQTQERLDNLQKENETLKVLVNHLASRPSPYQPKDPYSPPWVVTS
jgi:hypothetical protein